MPDDIAVAGFDDIPLARYVHPALTTIRVNIAELGARAARLLIAQIAGEAADEAPTSSSDLLETGLIVRESSGSRLLPRSPRRPVPRDVTVPCVCSL